MTGEVGDIDGGTNNNDKEAPTIPTGLAANVKGNKSFCQISMELHRQITRPSKGTNIYKGNNVMCMGTTDTECLDGNLKSKREYMWYQVSAYDEAGTNQQRTSFDCLLQDKKKKDDEAPSIPTGLTQGNLTTNSAQIL